MFYSWTIMKTWNACKAETSMNVTCRCVRNGATEETEPESPHANPPCELSTGKETFSLPTFQSLSPSLNRAIPKDKLGKLKWWNIHKYFSQAVRLGVRNTGLVSPNSYSSLGYGENFTVFYTVAV